MLLVSYAVMAVPCSCSSRWFAGLAERPGVGQFAHRFRHIPPLTSEIVSHGTAQIGIDNVMRGVASLRQVAARDLVLALRAGLDPLQPAPNRKIDGLVIADLEMQER